jgi:hypothetical protein
MADKNSPAARLLFIVDNDSSALGLIMYLLHRQPFLARATLVLPQRIYDYHQGGLSVTSHPYQSLQDILNIVDIDRPDIVCLFSGYSFVYQGLHSVRGLQKLIGQLRKRGCSLATSDPYFGTFRQSVDSPGRAGGFQNNLETRPQKFPRIFAAGTRLIQHSKERKQHKYARDVADCLKEVTHICPIPAKSLPVGDVRYLSFFNPMGVRSREELQEFSARVSNFPDVNANRPRWLFVLSQFDLEFQQKRYGSKGFVKIVASKLRQTLDSGKHPTFIGPAAFIDELSRQYGSDSGVSLLAPCPYEEFQSRFLDAEVVFCWQIFSISTFVRLLNGLPVFFFDRGRAASIFPPMHEAGLKCYYRVSPPTYLDIENPLDAARLTARSSAFRQSGHDNCQRLEKAHTPAELVSQILGSS